MSLTPACALLPTSVNCRYLASKSKLATKSKLLMQAEGWTCGALPRITGCTSGDARAALCIGPRSSSNYSPTCWLLLMLRRLRSKCTLKDIEACVSSCARRMGVEVQLFQSSDLGQCIHRLRSSHEDAVVINPGKCARAGAPRRVALWPTLTTYLHASAS